MQSKWPLLGGSGLGKNSNGTFISKVEKHAPGFKAGRDRLTLPFCTNAVGFMIKTGKLLTPKH